MVEFESIVRAAHLLAEYHHSLRFVKETEELAERAYQTLTQAYEYPDTWDVTACELDAQEKDTDHSHWVAFSQSMRLQLERAFFALRLPQDVMETALALLAEEAEGANTVVAATAIDMARAALGVYA